MPLNLTLLKLIGVRNWSNENYILQTGKKDFDRLKNNRALSKNVFMLLDILQKNPYQTPPPYEKLLGNMAGAYSRRINKKHRLVYRIDETAKEVEILSMWTHYERL